jgi:hypothetical protein
MRGGKPEQITAARCSGREPSAGGPTMLHMFVYFSVISLSVQISPVRPNPSHSATDIKSFQFRVKIFSRSTLAGESSGGRNRVSAALDNLCEDPHVFARECQM